MKQFKFISVYFLFFSLFANASNFELAPTCSYNDIKSGPGLVHLPVHESLELLALTPSQAYAQKLYLKLTGSPMPLQNPRFKRTTQLISEGKLLAAAKGIVAQEKNFLNVRVRNFAAPFSSKEFSPTEPLNDLQAMIVGAVRDGIDARQLLTGDFRYSGYVNLDLPAVSTENNDHFIRFDERQLNFQYDLEYVPKQWSNLGIGVGVFTTRAWAKVAYDAGTNRRSLRNAFELFLCAPIDGWKYRGVPDDFVRRDVDRSPGGNPSTYQNTCRSCHAIMDGMAGSFAKMDFAGQKFIFKADGIADKYNQNSNVYPAGYVTADDSWANLLDYNTTLDFGWRSPQQGIGLSAFATMISEAKGYSRCLVKRVYTEVCGQSILDADAQAVEPLTDEFEKNGRKLNELFARIAVQPSCISAPKGL